MSTTTTEELVSAIKSDYLFDGDHPFDLNEFLKTQPISHGCAYLFMVNGLKRLGLTHLFTVQSHWKLPETPEIVFSFLSRNSHNTSITVNIELDIAKGRGPILVGYSVEFLPDEPQSAKGKKLNIVDGDVTVPHEIIGIAEEFL